MKTNIKQAADHFLHYDKTMHELFTRSLNAKKPIILPTPKSKDKYFATIANSIVSQQISTKAAATIFNKIKQNIEINPKNIAKAKEEDLRSCGCSARKVIYLKSLANKWDSLEPEKFNKLDNQEISARLVSCHGIGQWTAEMFLIFAMARDDVFSIGDLGLRQQIATSYKIDRDDLKQIRKITAPWQPYRSLASLTLWHHLDNGPVLL